MIYATNKEWLSTLKKPAMGEVYIMSEDGVCGATCFIGSLEENGVAVPVPEGLEELQATYCL